MISFILSNNEIVFNHYTATPVRLHSCGVEGDAQTGKMAVQQWSSSFTASYTSKVAEYSYDPWGRLRYPVNQALYTTSTEPVLFTGWGYTGHEHLQPFGLINMNARLYDPVLGRFLSPDNVVQDPVTLKATTGTAIASITR